MLKVIHEVESYKDMNPKVLYNLEQGDYRLYGSINIFGFELWQYYIGSITIDENGGILTTSHPDSHRRDSDFICIYFFITEYGDIDYTRNFMANHIGFLQNVVCDDRRFKFYNKFLFTFKKAKYIKKYVY